MPETEHYILLCEVLASAELKQQNLKLSRRTRQYYQEKTRSGNFAAILRNILTP